MSARPRGAFIVIEGLDRAGKSTQCERLSQHLESKGHQVKRLRFPDRTTSTGQCINSYLAGESQQEDHAIHLLFSANRWEAAPQMRRDMAAGITLVVDRYVYSGMVYSAAKGLGDLSLGWARAPDVGLPRPDLCVFLDIEPEAAARRGGFGGEKYEEGGMQRRVRALFGEVWRREGEAVRVLDAGKEVEAVEMEIRALVETLLREGIDEGLRTIEPWGRQETG